MTTRGGRKNDRACNYDRAATTRNAVHNPRLLIRPAILRRVFADVSTTVQLCKLLFHQFNFALLSLDNVLRQLAQLRVFAISMAPSWCGIIILAKSLSGSPDIGAFFIF